MGELEEDETLRTYIRRKRLKKTELLDIPTGNMETQGDVADFSSTGLCSMLSSASLIQPVELESVPTINKDSFDLDMLAINLVEEESNDNLENVSNELCTVEEENIESSPVVSSGGSSLTLDRVFACCTKKKLLVLDVNGVLVGTNSFVPHNYDPDIILSKKPVFKRPYCDDFLSFCFERFNVGVWSSKTKRNMEPVVDFLFGSTKSKLLFHWDQSQCTYTGFYTVEKKDKPLMLKKLHKLWDKIDPNLPWEKGEYDESNTVLLDDSPCKALCNPNTAIFPFTYHFWNFKDKALGPGGDLRVYLEGLSMAENVQEYIKEHPFGQRSITDRNLSWQYYLKIIKEVKM